MSRADIGEHTEFWIIVDLKEGERERLEEIEEIMDECDDITDTRYFSRIFESSPDDLCELINEVLES